MQVAKALFDGQLLDVYFTRSFYKHILDVKVTYHDIEAVDPDYYKNLKWMLEVSGKQSLFNLLLFSLGWGCEQLRTCCKIATLLYLYVLLNIFH